jgi:hypothetical protein
VIQWKPKKRNCKVCGSRFLAERHNVWWCSAEHGAQLAIVKMAAARAKESRKAKAENRRKKRELETLGELKNRIQGYCNAYIRERDWGKPCFTCDRPHDGTHKRDAGHFKAVGAGGASPARYHPNNLRMTCTQCNTRRGGGNHPNYRPRLVADIGEDLVQAVERLHNSTVRWDRHALEQLGEWFRFEARRMKRERGQG